MASLSTGLLTLALAGAILAALVLLMLRKPLAVAAVILIVFVVTQGVRDDYEFPLVFKGTSIFLLDLLSLALVSIGVYRALSSGVVNAPLILVFALLLLLGVHFLRGAADFGVDSAFNKSRIAVYFISPIVYASTVKRWDARIWRLFPITSLVLLGIACFYYAKDGYHAMSESFIRNGVLVDVRPVTAVGGLVVLGSIILISALRWPSRRVALGFALVSAAGLIGLQQRTVWVAAIVTGLVGLSTWAATRTWNSRQLVVGAATSLASMLLVMSAFFLSHSLRADVTEITSSNSTIGWRITGWRELIAKYHSFTDIAFGLPAGASLDRRIHNTTVSVSPHSLYVDQYLRFGIPGVILIVSLGFLLWRHRAEIATRVGLTPRCVTLLLIALFVYGLTYELGVVQGLILGIFVAALSVRDAPSSTGIDRESDTSSDVLNLAAP